MSPQLLSDDSKLHQYLNSLGPIERNQVCIELEDLEAAVIQGLGEVGSIAGTKLLDGANHVRNMIRTDDQPDQQESSGLGKRDPFYNPLFDPYFLLSTYCGLEKLAEGKTFGEVKDDTINVVKNPVKSVNEFLD